MKIIFFKQLFTKRFLISIRVDFKNTNSERSARTFFLFCFFKSFIGTKTETVNAPLNVIISKPAFCFEDRITLSYPSPFAFDSLAKTDENENFLFFFFVCNFQWPLARWKGVRRGVPSGPLIKSAVRVFNGRVRVGRWRCVFHSENGCPKNKKKTFKTIRTFWRLRGEKHLHGKNQRSRLGGRRPVRPRKKVAHGDHRNNGFRRNKKQIPERNARARAPAAVMIVMIATANNDNAPAHLPLTFTNFDALRIIPQPYGVGRRTGRRVHRVLGRSHRNALLARTTASERPPCFVMESATRKSAHELRNPYGTTHPGNTGSRLLVNYI